MSIEELANKLRLKEHLVTTDGRFVHCPHCVSQIFEEYISNQK